MPNTSTRATYAGSGTMYAPDITGLIHVINIDYQTVGYLQIINVIDVGAAIPALVVAFAPSVEAIQS